MLRCENDEDEADALARLTVELACLTSAVTMDTCLNLMASATTNRILLLKLEPKI